MSSKSQGSSVGVALLASITPLHPLQTVRMLVSAILITSSLQRAVSIVIESGADGNFWAASLVADLHLSTTALQTALVAKARTGQQLARITHVTSPVSLLISSNHCETIVFHVLTSSDVHVVFGHPWLVKHNPHIDWANNNILGWGPFCLSHCLQNALSPQHPVSPSPEEPVDLSNIPPKYLDYKVVFCKTRATSLPPHHPYDITIELLPGTFPPRGRLYSLSAPETEAMSSYVEESLAAGIICPSSSPAGAGFFFVGKKDGTLLPCIDYRGLNNITVKNRYPIPLMSSAFQMLQGAKVFSKLNLCSYKGGDEWKTAFNTPSGPSEKCEFHKNSVDFLGHIITTEGI